VGKGIGVSGNAGKQGTILIEQVHGGFGYPEPARGPGKGLRQKTVFQFRINRPVAGKTFQGKKVGRAVEIRRIPVKKPDVEDKFVGAGVETQQFPGGKVGQYPGLILKAAVGKLPGREDLGTYGVEVIYLQIDCGVGVVEILLRLFPKLAGVGGEKDGFVENAEKRRREDQAEDIRKKIVGKRTPEYSAKP
jgi:hypothetical protein